MEKVQEMISFTVLLNCKVDGPREALQRLGIPPQDISSYGAPTPEFLEMQRNGALVSATTGDFTHSADLFLFDVDTAKLESTFQALSQQGIEVAMPSVNDPDPEVHWYWSNGQRRQVRVVDWNGKLEVLDPLAKHGVE